MKKSKDMSVLSRPNGIQRVKRRNRTKNGGKYRCMYCGRVSDTITIDHFIPKVWGGSNKVSNLIPSCAECNTNKADNDNTIKSLHNLEISLRYPCSEEKMESILNRERDKIKKLGCQFYPITCIDDFFNW